jgi:hypothetical protein
MARSRPGGDMTNPLGQDGPLTGHNVVKSERWRRNSRAGIGIAWGG